MNKNSTSEWIYDICANSKLDKCGDFLQASNANSKSLLMCLTEKNLAKVIVQCNHDLVTLLFSAKNESDNFTRS